MSWEFIENILTRNIEAGVCIHCKELCPVVLTENYFFSNKRFEDVECWMQEMWVTSPGQVDHSREKVGIDNDGSVVYSTNPSNNRRVEIFTFPSFSADSKGSVCPSNLTNIQRSTMPLSLDDIDGGGCHCRDNRPQRSRGCSCVIYRLKI